jgi:hypothetical protein
MIVILIIVLFQLIQNLLVNFVQLSFGKGDSFFFFCKNGCNSHAAAEATDGNGKVTVPRSRKRTDAIKKSRCIAVTQMRDLVSKKQ